MPDGDDDVVEEGDEGAEREGELEADGDVDQDGEQADAEGDERVEQEFLPRVAETSSRLLAGSTSLGRRRRRPRLCARPGAGCPGAVRR